MTRDVITVPPDYTAEETAQVLQKNKISGAPVVDADGQLVGTIKGIGAALLQRCLSIANERGIEKVMGTVLAQSTQMLALGKKLGFKINRVLGMGEYELSLVFQTN
jgi:predicted transcriptional regulator